MKSTGSGTKTGRGPRESTWRVIARCLAILRRVGRGPAAWRDLVEAVRREIGQDAYSSTSGEALRRRVERDVARLRWLGVEVRFDRRIWGYTIHCFRKPWIALPDPDLQALARLLAAGDPEVQALAERIARHLGPLERKLGKKKKEGGAP